MLINVNRVSAFDLFVVSEGNFLAKIISIRYQSVVRRRGRRGGRIDVEGEQGDPFHARFPPVKVRLVISIEDIYIYIYEMIEGQVVSKPLPEKFLRRLTRYRRLESGFFELLDHLRKDPSLCKTALLWICKKITRLCEIPSSERR